MSKMETGDFEISPEPLRRRQVIGNCCDMLALKARESGLDLAMRLPRRPAGDRGGQARVQADSAQSDFQRREIHRPGRARDGCGAYRGADIVITVEDTGVGISADDLPQIGRPFFQARGAYDRRHDGTGLGLSIVQGLVALHGGDVDIQAGWARARGSASACRSIARRRGRRASPRTWRIPRSTAWPKRQKL